MGFEALSVFARDVGRVGIGAHHTLPVCLSRASVHESAWEPHSISDQIQKHLPPVLPWSGVLVQGHQQIMYFVLYCCLRPCPLCLVCA